MTHMLTCTHMLIACAEARTWWKSADHLLFIYMYVLLQRLLRLKTNETMFTLASVIETKINGLKLSNYVINNKI